MAGIAQTFEREAITAEIKLSYLCMVNYVALFSLWDD